MESPLVLIQITDPHLSADPQADLLGLNTDNALRGVIEYIKKQEPYIDVLLATGDIAQDGSTAAYQRFLQHVAGVDAPMRGLPGNHDNQENFLAVLGGHANPVIDIGRWRIVMLDSSIPDSNAGHLAPDQLELLQTAATQAHGRHVLVAVHHNPVLMQCAWLDDMTIDNAAALFHCLEGLTNVQCLLWGHVHQEYDEVYRYRSGAMTTPEHELRLIASPSTCVQFAPRSPTFQLDPAAPAYRWLKLYPNGAIKTGVQRVEGLAADLDLDSKGY